MASPLKVAVIGVGHLGKEHARIYAGLPQAELIGVCDTNADKKEISGIYGVPFYSDYRKVIPLVDAVSIATPTSTHYAIAREFLEKGTHTLVEKPITLRLEDANELIDLAREKNCALQVGHIERHNPGLRRIEQIAKNIRFFEI